MLRMINDSIAIYRNRRESFSLEPEDPHVASSLYATNYVQGLQETDGGDPNPLEVLEDRSSEGLKVDVAGPVQRQFLDLVPISSHGTDSQHSLSSDTQDADDVEETAKSMDKPRTCDVRVQQQRRPGTDPAANSPTVLNAQEKGHPDSLDHESWTANKAQKVAAAKVRRAQEAVVNGRPFSETLVQVLYNLNEQLQTEDIDIPLTQIRPVKKIAIVVVTGDRGLCGGYNNFVLKKAERRMAELRELGLNYTVVSIGKKGNSYFNSSFMQAAAESLMSCSPASMATISASAPIPLVTPKLDVFTFGVVMLKLLMYTYMENGSLGQILHGEKAKNLQWCDRWEIVEGIAHALAYLHYDCSPPIVHRDISCNNVLLDSAFQACVSDFGTAKLLDAHTSIFLNVFLLGSLGKRSYLRFSIFSLVAVVFYSVYSVHASYDAECRAAATASSTPGPPAIIEGHVIELSTAAALSRSFTSCVIDSG